VDDASKTRGNIYLNVETSLLFSPPIKISGYVPVTRWPPWSFTGPKPTKNFWGAEVTFGNDYVVIDVQSTVMRPFCHDHVTNSGGELFSKRGGGGSAIPAYHKKKMMINS